VARFRGEVAGFGRNAPRESISERERVTVIPRGLDATAANLILVSDKVRQVVAGQIPLPEVVELFLTNYCNFTCPFCRCAKYHGDTGQFMDFDTLARLSKLAG
jgi:2-iminoacetate synthase ThiH